MNVTHPLAEAWLARLAAVSGRLPADRAAELEADLRDHLVAALAGAADEDAVRRVLADLGEPEAVVAEAASDLPPARQAPDVRREVAALVLIVGAPVLLFFPPLTGLAWLVGVVLLWTSRVWTVGDKLLGMVPALTPAAVVVLGLTNWTAASRVVVVEGAEGGPQVGPLLPESDPTVWLGVLAALVVASVVAVVVLARRLRR